MSWFVCDLWVATARHKSCNHRHGIYRSQLMGDVQRQRYGEVSKCSQNLFSVFRFAEATLEIASKMYTLWDMWKTCFEAGKEASKLLGILGFLLPDHVQRTLILN